MVIIGKRILTDTRPYHPDIGNILMQTKSVKYIIESEGKFLTSSGKLSRDPDKADEMLSSSCVGQANHRFKRKNGFLGRVLRVEITKTYTEV